MINNSSPNKLIKIPATLGRQPKYHRNEGCLSDPKTTNLPLTSLPLILTGETQMIPKKKGEASIQRKRARAEQMTKH